MDSPHHLSGFDNEAFLERSRRRARELATAALFAATAERTRENAALDREYQRGRAEAEDAAHQAGYVMGFDWGLICGGVLAFVLGGVALLVYVHAPWARLAAALGGPA